MQRLGTRHVTCCAASPFAQTDRARVWRINQCRHGLICREMMLGHAGLLVLGVRWDQPGNGGKSNAPLPPWMRFSHAARQRNERCTQDAATRRDDTCRDTPSGTDTGPWGAVWGGNWHRGQSCGRAQTACSLAAARHNPGKRSARAQSDTYATDDAPHTTCPFLPPY